MCSFKSYSGAIVKGKSEGEKPVTGKVAIVVGGSSGIGEGIARDFAKKGIRIVIVCSKSMEKAEKIADELNRQYGSSTAIAMQVNAIDEEAVKKMVERTRFYGGW